jgi:hypothetical protein
MLVEICETGDREANKLIAMNEANGYKVFTQKIRNKQTGFTRECYYIDILSTRVVNGDYVNYVHQPYVAPSVKYLPVTQGTFTFEKK